jgi:hypothetical protein
MKNWMNIAIFLAATALSAAGQQPSQSQPANPAEPATVASGKPMSQPLPGSLNSNREQPPADLKKMAENLNEQRRGEIEQHNQQLKERFTSLQEAGGWQSVFATQLKLHRLADPNAPHLNEAQQFITNFVFCDRPVIAGNTSEFQTLTNDLHLKSVSRQFEVEPLASIIINGCSFGPETGEVRLILNHDAGSFVALQVNDWTDSSIFATLEAAPAIPDQEAQLVVIRKDGTQSVPMAVEFFQQRVAHVFKVPGRIDDLRVASSSHLTE